MVNKQVDNQLYNEIIKIKNTDYSSYDNFYGLTSEFVYGLICSIVSEKTHADAIIVNVYNEICSRISECVPEDMFYVWAGRLTTYCVFCYAAEMGMNLEYQNVHGDGVFYENIYEDTEKFIPGQILGSMEHMRIIKRYIDGLPMMHNIILQYYYYEGMSVSDIEATLGIDRSYISNILKQIRKQLKEFVYAGNNQEETFYSLSEVPVFWIAFESILEGVVTSGVATVAGNVAVSGAGAYGYGANNVGGLEYGFAGNNLEITEFEQKTVMMNDGFGVMPSSNNAGISSGSGVGVAENGIGNGNMGVGVSGAGIGSSPMGLAGAGTSSVGAVTGSTAGATAGATAAGTSIAVKIIAGISIAGVLTAGGFGIHHVLTSDNEEKDEIATMSDASETDASETDASNTDASETDVETTEEVVELTYEEIRTMAFEDFLANPGTYNYLMYDNEGIYRRANYYTYQNCDEDPEEELVFAVRDDGFGIAYLDVDPESEELYSTFGSFMLGQAPQTVTDDVNWMQAYDTRIGEIIWGEYANADGNGYSLSAALHDFDGNGVPEIFIFGTSYLPMYGYTYADGILKDTGGGLVIWGQSFVKDNLLINNDGSAGVPGPQNLYVYEFKDNVFQLVKNYRLSEYPNEDGGEYITDAMITDAVVVVPFTEFKNVVSGYGLEVVSEAVTVETNNFYHFSYTIVADNVSEIDYADYSDNYGDLAYKIWCYPYAEN